jgi:cytoplasmic iron level regulating protein YaaA (DUF328/UPF0246 family)
MTCPLGIPGTIATVLILLPPSEGKSAPTRGKPLDLAGLALPSLTAARATVIDALVALCADDRAKAMAVLGVPKTQPELVERNAALWSAPTARADRVYTGVVYDALAPGTLSAAGKRRLGRVMVASSVFGLVGMADRIPAYRLSGDTSLPGLGGVQAHWRSHLDAAAREALGSGLLVDLRSGTYAAFWRPAADLASRVATVRVLHEVAGVRKVVSHFNKATKGRITRDLLEAGAAPRTPAALADALRDLGWSVEVTASTPGGARLDVVVGEL